MRIPGPQRPRARQGALSRPRREQRCPSKVRGEVGVALSLISVRPAPPGAPPPPVAPRSSPPPLGPHPWRLQRPEGGGRGGVLGLGRTRHRGGQGCGEDPGPRTTPSPPIPPGTPARSSRRPRAGQSAAGPLRRGASGPEADLGRGPTSGRGETSGGGGRGGGGGNDLGRREGGPTSAGAAPLTCSRRHLLVARARGLGVASAATPAAALRPWARPALRRASASAAPAAPGPHPAPPGPPPSALGRAAPPLPVRGDPTVPPARGEGVGHAGGTRGDTRGGYAGGGPGGHTGRAQMDT